MVLESFNNGILYIDIAFVYNRCTVYKVFRIKGSDCMKIEKVNDKDVYKRQVCNVRQKKPPSQVNMPAGLHTQIKYLSLIHI